VTNGRVVELWRYPVKSLAGERLDDVALAADGIPGDRAFAIVATGDGKILTAKRYPQLLAAAATWCDGTVTITLPDHFRIRSDDARCADVLSQWLLRDVRLQRPVGGTRATVQYDVEPDDASATGHFQLPKGSFHDSRSTLHILSEQSLAAARDLHDGDWDRRRFRPNVVVDMEGTGFVEDSWSGAVVAVGPARVFVRKLTVRCVLPTRQQYGLPRDAQLFRTLLRERDGNLGVYANVRAPGRVRTGDAVVA
jgi:uncharacterized protein